MIRHSHHAHIHLKIRLMGIRQDRAGLIRKFQMETVSDLHAAGLGHHQTHAAETDVPDNHPFGTLAQNTDEPFLADHDPFVTTTVDLRAFVFGINNIDIAEHRQSTADHLCIFPHIRLLAHYRKRMVDHAGHLEIDQFALKSRRFQHTKNVHIMKHPAKHVPVCARRFQHFLLKTYCFSVLFTLQIHRVSGVNLSQIHYDLPGLFYLYSQTRSSQKKILSQ